jgi:hypothetical protein
LCSRLQYCLRRLQRVILLSSFSPSSFLLPLPPSSSSFLFLLPPSSFLLPPSSFLPFLLPLLPPSYPFSTVCEEFDAIFGLISFLTEIFKLRSGKNSKVLRNLDRIFVRIENGDPKWMEKEGGGAEGMEEKEGERRVREGEEERGRGVWWYWRWFWRDQVPEVAQALITRYEKKKKEPKSV